VRVGVGVLPNGVGGPAAGNGRGVRVIGGQPQRVHLAEFAGVAQAVAPEIVAGVDHGLFVGHAVHGLGEVPDPGGQLPGGLAVAAVQACVGVVLDVQDRGHRHAVGGPAAAVVDEELGL